MRSARLSESPTSCYHSAHPCYGLRCFISYPKWLVGTIIASFFYGNVDKISCKSLASSFSCKPTCVVVSKVLMLIGHLSMS